MEHHVAFLVEDWSFLLQVNRTVQGLKCLPFVLYPRYAVFLKPILFPRGGLPLTELNMSEGYYGLGFREGVV